MFNVAKNVLKVDSNEFWEGRLSIHAQHTYLTPESVTGRFSSNEC